jgi:hypothetical protein
LIFQNNLYQICSAYETDSVPPVLGFWHCENVPLLDESGQLNIHEDSEPRDPRHLIPNPINCQKANCTCVQSPEDHNLVLIRWRAANDPLLYKSIVPANYAVHYTINNTDVKKQEFDK